MDQDFVSINQKHSIIEVSLADLQTYKDVKVVVLFGFPYDEGTVRNKGRAGGEGAYEQVILLLKQHIPILPYKVLHLAGLPKQLPLEEAHLLLYQHVGEVYYQLPQALVIVIGGSNDQSYPNFKGLVDGTGKKGFGVINIDAHLDVRPLVNGLAHSGSPFRQMLEDQERFCKQCQFVEFGIKGCTSSYQHHEYLKSKGGRVVFMEKDIRRCNAENQGLCEFRKVMDEWDKNEDISHVFVSFDVDSINSAWCPGVSAPSVVGGLTNVEALSIMEKAGTCKKVKLVDLSEYNPAVECQRTGLLISEMIIRLLQSYV